MQISDCKFLVSGFRFQVSGSRFQVTSCVLRVACFKFQFKAGSCVDCPVSTFFGPFVSTAPAHDATQSMASSRRRVGADFEGASSLISQVDKDGSAATASDWEFPRRRHRSKTVTVCHRSRCELLQQKRKGVEDQGIYGCVATRKLRGDVRKPFSRRHNGSQTIPPVKHQIRATEEFFGASQEAVASARCRNPGGSGSSA